MRKEIVTVLAIMALIFLIYSIAKPTHLHQDIEMEYCGGCHTEDSILSMHGSVDPMETGCGLWSVVCGLWSVVCGLWFMISILIMFWQDNVKCTAIFITFRPDYAIMHSDYFLTNDKSKSDTAVFPD